MYYIKYKYKDNAVEMDMFIAKSNNLNQIAYLLSDILKFSEILNIYPNEECKFVLVEDKENHELSLDMVNNRKKLLLEEFIRTKIYMYNQVSFAL